MLSNPLILQMNRRRLSNFLKAPQLDCSGDRTGTQTLGPGSIPGGMEPESEVNLPDPNAGIALRLLWGWIHFLGLP